MNPNSIFFAVVLISAYQLAIAYTDKDLYSLLGVTRKGKATDVKKAYRKLSMKYHPDKNPDPQAADKFREISEAYQILSDEEKRKIYDSQGIEGIKMHDQKVASGAGGGGFDPFDMFGSFFGRREQHETVKVPTMVNKLRVTLDQLFTGELLHASVTRPVLCINFDDCMSTDNQCHGPGLKVVTQQVGPGFIVQNQVRDESCVAKRKSWKKNCKECPNGATELEPIFLSVHVEKGMEHGDQINFEGGGEQRVGHEHGDVLFIVEELPHSRFTRKQTTLSTTVEITLLEALVGFERKIPVFGEDVLVSRTEVTHDGQVIGLKGKGMPARSSGRQGDLRVTVRVKFPEKLETGEQGKVREALGSVKKWRPVQY
eukprot:GHVU01066519.1.p1 GENE.GHVU01066519.1~~GHVU01066519.1.p1  ORF type:complete len:371 (-),score=48.80 GHVU01066519.1:736-1848(-)